MVFCSNRIHAAIVLMELIIEERDECLLHSREMFNVHWNTLTDNLIFSSRSWSSPLFVIQTRTGIRPRNSLWLVSICYCSVWDAWHLCLKDRGQVSGGGERCAATETRSSASLLQHPGTPRALRASRAVTWLLCWHDFRYLLCPLTWPCMGMCVCLTYADLMVTSEPSLSLPSSREC